MRLFVGINLPKKQRARIHSAARKLREEDVPIRWVEPDNFHVTLKFLGEVRRERVPSVQEAMGRVAGSTRAFDTVLRGFGAFPTIRRPRVLWLGVWANPELRCLKQDLEWTLGEIGFDAETRAFHPHITLGRAEAGGGAGEFRGLDELIAAMTFDDELRVHTIDLMRSHLSKAGTRYSVVSSARLATG